MLSDGLCRRVFSAEFGGSACMDERGGRGHRETGFAIRSEFDNAARIAAPALAVMLI